jgi:hypothetical protein
LTILNFVIKLGQKEGYEMKWWPEEGECSAFEKWFCLLMIPPLVLLMVAHLPFMLGVFLWEVLEQDRWWCLFGVVLVAIIVCGLLWWMAQSDRDEKRRLTEGGK